MNIIVQNRTTGQLEEEKMQVYVQLGICLLYKASVTQPSMAQRRTEIVLFVMARVLAQGLRAHKVHTCCSDIKYSLSDSWILSTARKLLKSLSIKQGIKYDLPKLAQENLHPAFQCQS